VSAPPDRPQERPVSAPPNRPAGAGRVFVSGGVPEPSTRYDEYGSPVRQDAPAPPPPAATRRLPRDETPPATSGARGVWSDRPAPAGARKRRGPIARAVLTLFVLVMLVVTPLAAGVVSYYLTTDHLPAPIQDWLHRGK
jgi:hypothetical protein